jgi:hypothetical protein
MPFAAARRAHPARIQVQRNGFWRDDPRRLQLPDERRQGSGPDE